jgi:hypothetical protein
LLLVFGGVGFLHVPVFVADQLRDGYECAWLVETLPARKRRKGFFVVNIRYDLSTP